MGRALLQLVRAVVLQRVEGVGNRLDQANVDPLMEAGDICLEASWEYLEASYVRKT